MKTKVFLIALLAQICVLSAMADTVTVNGIMYEIDKSTKTATAYGFDLSDEEIWEIRKSDYIDKWNIVIPSRISVDNTTYKVISINGFNSKLNAYDTNVGYSIYVSEGITSIEDYAFYGGSMVRISIPKSITSIGGNALPGCYIEISDLASWCNIQFERNDRFQYKYDVLGNEIYTQRTLVPSGQTFRSFYYGDVRDIDLVLPQGITAINDYAFSYFKNIASVTIPEGVKTIGKEAFYNYSANSLTSVSFPNSLNSIGERAFDGCKFDSVTIPENVSEIGQDAITIVNKLTILCPTVGAGWFKDRYLTEVILGDQVKTIESSAFYNCTRLATVEIPESVSRVDRNAFGKTAWLDAQPDGMVYTGSCLYCYKGTMPENTFIKVREGTKSITAYAFSPSASFAPAKDCKGLTEISIPNSVTSIGDCTFQGCSGLKNVTIGEGLSEVGLYTFYGCTQLNEIICYAKQVPATGNYIASSSDKFHATMHVFASLSENYKQSKWGCFFINPMDENNQPVRYLFEKTSADEVAFTGSYMCYTTIPETTIIEDKEYRVTSIGDEAKFYIGPIEVTIPETVKTIGNYVFYQCQGLTSLEIPNGVTSIGDFSISNCNNLTSVSLPNSLTTIGHQSFINNTKLTSLDIPNGVASIGDGSISHCKNLKAVTLPNSLTNIGWGILKNCDSLSSITIADGNPKYDSRENSNAIIETATNTLIAGCKDTQIPNSIKKIGSNAFYYCTSLTSIDIPEGVEVIDTAAFQSCTKLASIALPQSLTKIETWAFRSCESLRSITIPDNTTYLGSMCFLFCSALSEITLPESVSYLGDGAFAGCERLSSIAIPCNVTTIGEWCFQDCKSLIEVKSYLKQPFEINDNVFQISPSNYTGNYTFTSATLYVPAGTKALYEATEGWKNFQTIVEMGDEVPEGIAIDETNVPDENFRNYLLSQSYGEDGVLTEEEIAAIETMNVDGKNIQNLQGLDLFTNLRELHCSSNHLTVLDLSKNVALFKLDCSGNQIKDEAMDALINSLPAVEVGEWYVMNEQSETEDNVITMAQVAAAKEKGWKVYRFDGTEWSEIETAINPMDDDKAIDFGNEGGIDEQTNLDGNIVGNLYFNISNGNGSYNADEDCIVINNATSEEVMATIEDKAFFDPTFREQFTGLIFKVPAGSGKVKVTAETTGNMVLKVKIGSGEPVEMELEGKLKVSFPYNVTEESLVYIYAGENNSAAVKSIYRTPEEETGTLKIYGIEWSKDEVDYIRTIENGQLTARPYGTLDPSRMDNAVIYNLSGQRLSKPQRGVNIINGRKVIVK